MRDGGLGDDGRSLLGGSADLEADGLELVRHLGHLLVAEVELERERLQLGGLHVAALLRDLEEVATGLCVERFMHGVLTHVVSLDPFAEKRQVGLRLSLTNVLTL